MVQNNNSMTQKNTFSKIIEKKFKLLVCSVKMSNKPNINILK